MLRLNLYHKLVNIVPIICYKYHKLRDNKKGLFWRILAWFYLIGLNIGYHILHLKSLQIDLRLYPDTNKKVSLHESESALSKKESPKDFSKKLLEYDIISFDIFDTLILRPFDKPTSLFYKVGEKLGYLDFTRLRIEMEYKARERCFKLHGHREVTLEDIYEQMEEQVGIKKEVGMLCEITVEEEFCFANPYFVEVMRELSYHKKKVIAITDMYLSKKVIREMLDKCGFDFIKTIYVSCEYGTSKSDGNLYDNVKNDLAGDGKQFIHIGDNEHSDIKMACKKGFTSIHYQNVNEVGNQYRVEDMSVVTGAIYRGIVNAHLHNGLKQYSPNYEFGFVYGGPIVLGYCQFIHEYVRTHAIDKILFLARDGDIINQAYQMLYPDECDAKGVETEYVYWSRLAATKMTAAHYKYDFFRRFLYHKVNQGYKVLEILQSMELEDMLDELMSLSGGAIKPSSSFTSRNIEFIKGYLMSRWEQVLSHYEEQIAAGKVYYEKVLKGHKKVVAIDVGWAGSGAVTLNYLVNQVWNIDCNIIGLLLGTNSAHNAEPNASEPLLNSGQLVSYAFSQSHNRDMWKSHDPNKGHNLVVERLFGSAREGSFRKFELNENGKVEVVCKEQDVVEGMEQEEIQRGVLEFVKLNKCNIKGLQFKTGDIVGMIKILNISSEFISKLEFVNI